LTVGSSQIDWAKIAERMQVEVGKLVHQEGGTSYCGNELYAEALRRTFGYAAADESDPGSRALPYEHLWQGHGLTTEAQADWTLKGATALSKAQAEDAEKEIAEARTEMQRVYREAATDLANLIRGRCNERTVPSKYRRDGVHWAADLIDPTVPKDRFGNVVKPVASPEKGS
jgi:hypothetical protein